MAPEQLAMIAKLSGCSLIPGSPEKRFIRALTKATPDAELSDKQDIWLRILMYKYRRQTGFVGPRPPEYRASLIANQAQADEAKLKRWIESNNNERQNV